MIEAVITLLLLSWSVCAIRSAKKHGCKGSCAQCRACEKDKKTSPVK